MTEETMTTDEAFEHFTGVDKNRQTCHNPDCKIPRFGTADYCICGHKWPEDICLDLMWDMILNPTPYGGKK